MSDPNPYPPPDNIPSEPTAQRLRALVGDLKSINRGAKPPETLLSRTKSWLWQAAARLTPMDDPPYEHGDPVRVVPEDGEPFDARVMQWGHGTPWVWTEDGWKVHVARWEDGEAHGKTYVCLPSELEPRHNEVGVVE